MLRLPPLVGALPASRLLPVWVFDRFMDLLGVYRSMDDFVGHRAGSPDTPGR